MKNALDIFENGRIIRQVETSEGERRESDEVWAWDNGGCSSLETAPVQPSLAVVTSTQVVWNKVMRDIKAIEFHHKGKLHNLHGPAKIINQGDVQTQYYYVEGNYLGEGSVGEKSLNIIRVNNYDDMDPISLSEDEVEGYRNSVLTDNEPIIRYFLRNLRTGKISRDEINEDNLGESLLKFIEQETKKSKEGVKVSYLRRLLTSGAIVFTISAIGPIGKHQSLDLYDKAWNQAERTMIVEDENNAASKPVFKIERNEAVCDAFGKDHVYCDFLTTYEVEHLPSLEQGYSKDRTAELIKYTKDSPDKLKKLFINGSLENEFSRETIIGLLDMCADHGRKDSVKVIMQYADVNGTMASNAYAKALLNKHPLTAQNILDGWLSRTNKSGAFHFPKGIEYSPMLIEHILKTHNLNPKEKSSLMLRVMTSILKEADALDGVDSEHMFSTNNEKYINGPETLRELETNILKKLDKRLGKSYTVLFKADIATPDDAINVKWEILKEKLHRFWDLI